MQQQQQKQQQQNSAPTPDKISFASLFQDLVDSILVGGINRGVIHSLNMIFMLLFFLILIIIYVTGPNIHLVALLLLALGVFFGTQGFIAQVKTTAPEAANPLSPSSIPTSISTSSTSGPSTTTAEKRKSKPVRKRL